MSQRKYEPTKILIPGQPHWQALGQTKEDAEALYRDALEHGDIVKPTAGRVVQRIGPKG